MLDYVVPPAQLGLALLHAAEHFRLDACSQLLEREAPVTMRDANELSALDHLVRLGCVRLSTHKGYRSGRSCEERSLWSTVVDELVRSGADPFSQSGITPPVHDLLAHCPWPLWPCRLRQQLSDALAGDAHAESPILSGVWSNAGLHAFALAPSDETVRLATMLLELGACARAQLGGSQQTVLHLLAAGGAYSCEDGGLVFSGAPHGAAEGGDASVESALELAVLVCEYGADWRQRDSKKNTAAHVACAAGNVRMVQLLSGQGSKFEKPWFNERGKTPSQLAALGGGVLAWLHEHERRVVQERRKREQEVEALHGATSIEWVDPHTGAALLDTGASSEQLLAAGRGGTTAGSSGARPTTATKRVAAGMAAAEPAAGGGGGGGGGGGSLSAGSKVGEERLSNGAEGGGEPEAIKVEACEALRAERLRLFEQLSFVQQPWQVSLTRHSLEQLRLLHQADAGRCHNALRVLHRLAEGTEAPGVSEVLLERGHPGPLCCSESKATHNKVYVVWCVHPPRSLQRLPSRWCLPPPSHPMGFPALASPQGCACLRDSRVQGALRAALF